MERREDARDKTARHLIEACAKVREDVSRVELWATALSAFTQPIPDYNSGDFTVWLPREQGKTLKSSGRN